MKHLNTFVRALVVTIAVFELVACGGADIVSTGTSTAAAGPNTGSGSSGSGSSGSGSSSSSPTSPAPNPPTSVPNPADLVFFDNFEYTVGRNDSSATQIFQSHGWTWAKTQQSMPNNRCLGYLYTVGTGELPGYLGAFPGGASSRVLAMEARPGTGIPELNYPPGQTSFHLQYGDGEAAINENRVPGNVWFQFWMYINYYGEQISRFDARNKFIYPCNTGYPCNSQKWLFYLEPNSYIPYWADVRSNPNVPTPAEGEIFIENHLNANDPNFGVATVTHTHLNADGSVIPSYNYGKLGHTNNTANFPIRPNQWTLVKIHIDTSTTYGAYEVWMRSQGSSSWVKVIEWIDEEHPNYSNRTPGFRWRINQPGGHRVFSMPTTAGSGNLDRPWDYWIYLDDFAMARSENGLPVY